MAEPNAVGAVVQCAASFAANPAVSCLLRILPLTSLATYSGTLYLCWRRFLEEGPHGGVQDMMMGMVTVNFTNEYEHCVEDLCDISLYGGWPEGTEHGIFRVGFSLLALQLAVMVFGRLGLLHSAAPRELREDLPCPMEVNLH